eukprot:84832-Prorocentrum_minimum.AAC.3
MAQKERRSAAHDSDGSSGRQLLRGVTNPVQRSQTTEVNWSGALGSGVSSFLSALFKQLDVYPESLVIV